MNYVEAREYVKSLNQGEGFVGYTDWRLPTVEELLSLIEPKEQWNNLHIDQISATPKDFVWYWSADIKEM